MSAKMSDEYASQLGEYDDEIDMCNQLGVNLDEIYEDDEDDK